MSGDGAYDPACCYPGPCDHEPLCPRCHGRGYLAEDPMPDCPAGPGTYEQTECPACEGTGEASHCDHMGTMTTAYGVNDGTYLRCSRCGARGCEVGPK